MQVDFDFEKMEQLLKSFYHISNVRYSLADTNNNLLCFSSEFSSFCSAMNGNEEGHCRCKQSDGDAIAHAAKMAEPYYTYRCHAGLLETIIPIRQHGDVIAYIMFGQMIESGDAEAQWQDTARRISWLVDWASYRNDFMKLQRLDRTTIQSCAEVLNACSSYICMEGLVRSASMSDEQQLHFFISHHYTEQLSLDKIAKALSMSKTKLCGVASRQGTTVMAMVNQKRMEEAKRFLRNRNDRISEISYLVGIRDYNYFTKLFKAYTGETPRAYQERFRKVR